MGIFLKSASEEFAPSFFHLATIYLGLGKSWDETDETGEKQKVYHFLD